VNVQLPNLDGSYPLIDPAALIPDVVYDLTIGNGATIGGAAALNIGSIYTGTDTSGNVVQVDRKTVANISVTGGSALNGAVNVQDTAEVTVTLDNSTLTGDITAADTASVVVTLHNNSVLTGKIDPVDLNIDNSTWNLTADSEVNNLHITNNGKVVFQDGGAYKTLTVENLSGNGGIFTLNTDLSTHEGDLIVITGSAAGDHHLDIHNKNHANVTGLEDPLLVVSNTNGGSSFGSDTFSGTTAVGMFDYSVRAADTTKGEEIGGWYLAPDYTPNPDPGPGPTPPTPPTPQVSPVGENLLAEVAAQAPAWFDHLNNIISHLGDLRGNANGATGKNLDSGILDSVWLKSYGAQLNVSGQVVGTAFREYNYGVDIGADHRWNLDANNQLIAGAFLGYGSSEREMRHTFGSKGETNSYGAGVYALWLHHTGLYADLVANAQYADHDTSAYDASNNHTTADYENWGAGVTLDLGKQFKFKDGWYAEPSLSAGYAHFTNSDYTTGGDNIFNVTIIDADGFQYRLCASFGRTIQLANGGILQPYLKIGGVEQISTGGKLRASNSEWHPTYDGLRAELGAGLIWQLNPHHQLHLDYEASFGDKYDKPWGLTAGYRYQF
jgi:outer membrane autotransporter protein